MTLKKLLQTLVEIPTVTGNSQANNQAFNYIADFVGSRGMHVERFTINGYESMVATSQKTKKPTVLLAAHLDVVPAPQDFFSLREIDGKYYGRGVLDMKFAIACYLKIIDNLKDTLSAYNIGLMVTSDEEAGGRNGVEALTKKGYLPKVCILPDGGDYWQIQTHSKGFLYINLQRYGKPAHGSRPWLGDNAIVSIIQAVQDIQKLFPVNGAKTNTMNVGKIIGGKAINQVADYAQVALDFRVMSEADKLELLQKIDAICTTYRLEKDIELNGTAASFSLENPYIAEFAKLITEVTKVPVTGAHTLGSNDTRHFIPYNIPCISFYPPGGNHHGPDEWLSVEGLEQAYTIISRYVATIGKNR